MTTKTVGLSSYKTFHTIADINIPDSDLTAAAGYVIGKPSGAVDLQILDGVSKHLKVNTISIIVHATGAEDGNMVTEKIYGAAESGPPQLVASIVWDIGQARADGETATFLWADTADISPFHIEEIKVADGSGSDRVCSVTFKLTGYRYILGKWTAHSGNPDTVTALYRSF